MVKDHPTPTASIRGTMALLPATNPLVMFWLGIRQLLIMLVMCRILMVITRVRSLAAWTHLHRALAYIAGLGSGVYSYTGRALIKFPFSLLITTTQWGCPLPHYTAQSNDSRPRQSEEQMKSMLNRLPLYHYSQHLTSSPFASNLQKQDDWMGTSATACATVSCFLIITASAFRPSRSRHS